MPWNEATLPARASISSATLAPEQVTAHASYDSEVRQYEYRGACVIAAVGEYDMGSITVLREALHTAAKQYPKVVLDASDIAFADSTFLNLLLITHRSGKLRIVAPSAQVRRLLEVTGVDGVLEIRQTIEEAIAA
ncbi:STAS domain-containing protein [Streptomyces sp. 71268]|uniref:STAS domain-containing protein n=1 Tax=Streptomyces sp. 71268 TaxID=3002640 RepID=UPI0023F75418|nr:STAS domain-containing protein [Streptomyces sp. 71268]WEV24329.1 STAS domain-containing protein [Streptomyces sp. 71268]